jgi:ATP-binding cassette subfamily B protein
MAHDRLSLFASTMLYPLNALCVVLPPYLLKQILDTAIPQGDMPRLWWLGGAYLGALVMEYLTGFAAELSMSVLGQRAMQRLRQDLFEHVQRLPIAFFERNPIGRILTRLTTDVEALGDVFASGAITLIADLLTVFAVVSMMFYLNVRLTFVAFGVVPPLVGLAVFFQGYARVAFRNIRTHIARINTFLAEHLSAMSVVQVFGQQARTEAEFDVLNEAYRDANRQAIFFDASLYSMVEAVGTVAIAVLIWAGAKDLTKGVVTAGMLVAFIQLVRRFFVPIRDLSTKYTVLQSALAAAERTFNLLEEPVTLVDAQDAKPIAAFKHSLTLEHVSFAYKPEPQSHDYILYDINLSVRRGERIALVGSTGSGKTTLLKLLNRSYDANQGRVCIDGEDVRALKLAELRRRFAVVLQDVHLFSGTIMQNLTFADRISADAARRAVNMVQANGLIERMPQGYDSPVQELGANFSAGERQLLSLARALALDPDILILDEATSNIDSDTEAHIQKALDVLLEGRTAVIVAHRLSTIQKVDRILVMQQGRIVQQGNHATLMQQEGIYKGLVKQQFVQREDVKSLS